MSKPAGRIHEMEHHAADWATTRPVVSGIQGVIAAGHPLVSMAGMRMLLAGGNAFDAAVAAGFAAAVVEPTASYTLCGECVALVYDARRGETKALSGQGTAPGLATIEAFRGRKLDRIPTGPGSDAHLSFTVPGAVDAYLTLLETLGTKTVSEVLVPAVHYAERGFPMYEYMHRLLAIPETRSQFDVYPPGGTAVFYPGGRVPEVGEVFVQPALAGTLRKLMEADAQGCDHRQAGIAAARQRFYRGDIAATIGAFSERLGGLLRASDLAGYRARLEPPVQMTFAGREIVAQAAWTQGPVLLQALGMLATLDLRALGHNSARYIHVVTEALKLAFADREAYYGDADSVPMAGLLSPAYARERAALIRSDRAMPEAPAPGDPRGRGAVATAERVATGGLGTGVAAGGADGTTHIAAIDRDGNMVCLTPSGGVFRKSAFAPELGCTLSTRSEMFVLEDGHPNGVVPGKRPRTTLVSYLICEDGVPTTTIGCPGGDDQAQADLQIVLNLLVFGMNPQQAVEAPRFSTQTLVNSFWPRAYKPGQLNVEPGIPERTRAELRALGHGVSEIGACGIGAVVTRRDPASGALSAGADPRRPTYALAW
ncbi:MAG TPA: gamma-glutamyltransferase [Patescibacteria group bacterium]|jgi:gamma-glutamyltranspeptidase/glutathione hydrolase|nr:gamma-glutamyltransferase [Patescibacteria group bacterium]